MDPHCAVGQLCSVHTALLLKEEILSLCESSWAAVEILVMTEQVHE